MTALVTLATVRSLHTNAQQVGNGVNTGDAKQVKLAGHKSLTWHRTQVHSLNNKNEQQSKIFEPICRCFFVLFLSKKKEKNRSEVGWRWDDGREG